MWTNLKLWGEGHGDKSRLTRSITLEALVCQGHGAKGHGSELICGREDSEGVESRLLQVEFNSYPGSQG